jgi:hypothetical protein
MLMLVGHSGWQAGDMQHACNTLVITSGLLEALDELWYRSIF